MVDENGWECEKCTYKNDMSVYHCEMCRTKRKREGRKRKATSDGRTAKRAKPFEDKPKPKKTYTKRKKKTEKEKPKRKPKRSPSPSPSPVAELEDSMVEEVEDDGKSEEQQFEERERTPPVHIPPELPSLQPITSTQRPEVQESKPSPAQEKLVKVIRRLEANFHNLDLKTINSIVIRDFIKSSEEDMIYFGTRLTQRTYILDSLLQKMIEVLTSQPVDKQMKNVGVLHKFIKGLQRFIDTGSEAIFSAVFQDQLSKAAKIDGLPIKTVKRITDLLGTIKLPDYQSPDRATQELTIPTDRFPGVDWAETILGQYGERRAEFEDKFSVVIRMSGKDAPGPNKVGPLKIDISGLQAWNVKFAQASLQDFIERPSNHKKKADKAFVKKRWKQVLDKDTKAHYYWHLDTNQVRWDAPPEGFTPVDASAPPSMAPGPR